MITKPLSKVPDAWITADGGAEGSVAIMQFKRIAQHWLMTQRQVSRAFPPHALKVIEATLKASEAEHTGKIRSVVEGSLGRIALFQGQTARARATELFVQRRNEDTRDNRGILIYLLLADGAVEILADSRISVKVPAQDWRRISCEMEAAFKTSNYATGLLVGVQLVASHLAKHFPVDAWQS